MLTKAKPQAAWAYTNTYDHRRVVEICARHGVHVMMEKPLAVNLEDAFAIEKAARDAKKIHVCELRNILVPKQSRSIRLCSTRRIR